MMSPSMRAPNKSLALVLALLAVGPAPSGWAEEAGSASRFSDQPAPLRLEGFPERPPPLIEWGDKFLGPGNLQKGFTLPSGAVWHPSFWVYGNLRSAIQTFDSGPARTSEWANRLDIFGNLQLAATERIVVGFRPLDQGD